MALQFQVPNYQQTPLPDIRNALAPINEGIDTYRQGMNDQFAGQMKQKQFGLEREKLDLAIDEKEYQRRRQTIHDIGLAAVAADNETDPAKRAVLHSAILSRHPEAASLPSAYRDPITGPKLLRAEAGKERDALDEQYKRAQIGLVGKQGVLADAHANYYNSRATQSAPQPEQRADPLAGAGMDEDGVIIPAGNAAPSASYGQGAGGQSWQLPAPPRAGLPPPMRLGGPRDDIDASMRVDAPAPIRVAQAGPPATSGYGYSPTPMEQAQARMFGPAGVSANQVPGIVTNGKGASDPLATREAQGQRAMQGATPEQQERLRKFRQDQQMWTNAYDGQKPRSGYYYGPEGREMAKSDKQFKGDREAQAAALLNLRKIDQASERLLQAPFLQRAFQGTIDQGEVGQAYSDMKQAAMGIAYALSGKTVAVAEMKNMMESYGPSPADSAERIKMKTARLKDFYGALISASRGGDSYEQAFAKASARMGIKNPDGSAMGGPAGADQPANDLSGVSTDELLRRLKGR